MRLAKLPIFSALIAFAGSRLVFSAMNFHYSLFQDPLSITKLAIDFGTWAALYLLASLALSRTVFRNTPPAG